MRVKALIVLFAALAMWEMAIRFGFLSGFLFPSMVDVAYSLNKLIVSGILVNHYLASLIRVLVGFTLGSIAGVAVGVAMGYSRVVYDSTFLILTLLYSIPAVAWIPLLIVWIGLRELLPIAVVFLCSFVPLVFITLTGVRGVDRNVINVAKTLGACRWKLVTSIIIPQALPSILSGLKVEIGMAWRSCFVAEMVAMSSGLGFLAMEASSMLRVDVIIVTVTVLAASNYLFQELFERLELMITKRRGDVA